MKPGGTRCKVLKDSAAVTTDSPYDNEWAGCCKVLDLLMHMSAVDRGDSVAARKAGAVVVRIN
jgi:hypothetical protein